MQNVRFIVAAGLLALPSVADSQASVFRTRVYAPRVFIGPTGDSTVLQQSCGKVVDSSRRYRVGDVVTKSETINKSLVLTRLDTLDSAEVAKIILVPAEPTNVPNGMTGLWGNLSIDKEDASILRVNPWFFTDSVLTFGSYRVTSREFNQCQFSYKLENRVSLPFWSRAWTVGAATIPFRIRRGYTATNDSVIGTDVGTQFSVALYGGGTIGRTRYFYSRGGENSLRESFKLTFGPFVALSSGTADAQSTRSADAPLGAGEKHHFISWSPGIAMLLSVRGVDVGLFRGRERVLGSAAAQKWDRNNRSWWGFGLGYQLFK